MFSFAVESNIATQACFLKYGKLQEIFTKMTITGKKMLVYRHCQQ